jgi:hypothetical protein
LKFAVLRSGLRAARLVEDDIMLTGWAKFLEYVFNVNYLHKLDYLVQLEWGVRFKLSGLDIPVISDASRAWKIQLDVIQNYDWNRATPEPEASSKAWNKLMSVYMDYDIFHETRSICEDAQRRYNDAPDLPHEDSSSSEDWTPGLADYNLNVDFTTLIEETCSLDAHNLTAWQVSDIFASLLFIL